ncbi:restriction endonuclease subunit S [Sulfurovum sp.]|jgi:restriction endonuclease S subunit|uniref:restriction endonuclease subunit S n=1 Tax=Sulfurovum sp. TaxID=1969726 RepID=UPI002A35E4EE|nr:restriction endonuclease subunit S [Sulfurovum sp.]MDY0402425.1 restriction endonuclease subunit S [Sulfurovum sp.]
MKLNELANIRVGLPLIRKKGDIHDDVFYRYQVITLKAFSSSGFLLLNELDEFIASEELSANYIAEEGDVLVRLREPNLAVYIDQYSAGLIVPALMAIVKPKKDMNSKYLTYFINSNSAQRQLKKELQGTTIPMLKTSELADLKVTIPSIETQDKIVSVLDLVNKELELLEELKNMKTQFKNEILDTILQRGVNQ